KSQNFIYCIASLGLSAKFILTRILSANSIQNSLKITSVCAFRRSFRICFWLRILINSTNTLELYNIPRVNAQETQYIAKKRDCLKFG
ncbi:hypothetical protein HZS_7406, partial [Henneguya salminicola]